MAPALNKVSSKVRLPPVSRGQQAVEEEIGQHAHGHAGHQYQNGGISRLPVASSVAQDFLKHSITPF